MRAIAVRAALVAAAAVGATLPASAQQVPHSGPSPPFEPFGIYLANEGVALNLDGPSLIVIDGLFREGVRGYQTIEPEVRERFEGEVFMDAGRLALATHHHPDHFDAGAVLAHLSNNPGSRFVSTPTAVSLLEALDPPPEVRARISASYPAESERERFDFEGRRGSIRLQTLNLHHGRRGTPIENLGHLVEAGGLRVLHMGDTEVTVDEIIQQGLAADRLDAAFVPYWLLLGRDGPRVVEAIGARRVFAIHLPLAEMPSEWWGDEGSLEGTIGALERLDGVDVLYEPWTRFTIR